MPANNPEEIVYASGVDMICGLIGYKAAFEALRKEHERLADSTLRQAFSFDGALMSDVADIAKQHPSYSIGFIKSGDNISVSIESTEGESSRAEAEQIIAKCNQAIANRVKLPGFDKYITMRIVEEEIEPL